MRAFWDEFSQAVDQTKDLKISDVINALDLDLGPHFFPAREDGSDPRQCVACGTGRLGLKLGRLGSFIGCSNYPECRYTRSLAVDNGVEGGDTLKDGQRTLGINSETSEEITVRRGPYGLYVQQGEQTEDKKVRPKRTTLPRGMDGDALTLEEARGLLAMPRTVGIHPETKEPIQVGIGRFGPYVRMGSVFGSLDRDDNVLALGLNRAVDLIAKKMASVRTLGTHPKDQEFVAVRKGRFGPYVQHGQMVANLPRGTAMDDVTLEEAVALLAEKGKALKPRGAAAKKGRARVGTKANGAAAPAPARAAPRKQAARKAAPNKVAAKKTAGAKTARGAAE
jgi:DNA topoisomerase-1